MPVQMFGSTALHSRLSPSWMAHRASLAGLYVLVLSVDLATAGFNLALAIIVLATLPMLPVIWRDLKEVPAFWLAAGLTVYVVVQSLVLTSLHPVMGESSNPHWTHVARVTGLVSFVIGWWLVQHRRHVPVLLGLAVFSLLANQLAAIDYGALLEDPFAARRTWGEAPVRVGFASAAGLVMSCAALLCLAFRASGPRRPSLRWLAIFGSGVIVAIFALMLYGSQTRGAWLGASVAILFLVGLTTFHAFRYGRALHVLAALLTLAAVVGSVIVATDHGNVVERRVTGEAAAFEAVVALDREALYEANRSMGRRVNMWTEALLALRDSPWFGHGVGTKEVLKQRSELDIGGTGHLHSIYVELAYSLGMVGAVGFVLVYGLLFRRFVRAWRGGVVHDGLALIVIAFWVMTLVALLTDVRIGHANSRALLMFMLAMVCFAVLMLQRSPNSASGQAAEKQGE